MCDVLEELWPEFQWRIPSSALSDNTWALAVKRGSLRADDLKRIPLVRRQCLHSWITSAMSSMSPGWAQAVRRSRSSWLVANALMIRAMV